MRLFRPMQTSLCPGSFVSNLDLALVCGCVSKWLTFVWYQVIPLVYQVQKMKGKFKYRVVYSITQAGCSPLAIEWLEVFFVLTSVVEEASGTLLRLQVVQVALLQVALRSSSSVFREHFYFCLGTCSRLMDTPTSLRIPYILLHVMIDCCRKKHFNIRSLIFSGKTFHDIDDICQHIWQNLAEAPFRARTPIALCVALEMFFSSLSRQDLKLSALSSRLEMCFFITQ